MTLNDIVYNCLASKLTAPSDARSVCDSWHSCW